MCIVHLVASRYGKVSDVYFPKEKESMKRRGFCYVRFDNPKAADAAATRSARTIGGNEQGEIKMAHYCTGYSLSQPR